ncbi:MAG: class I SAM-dependent methyltransferase [Gammaproteobacteria bacterium]|nr:class I SAM-dependent methyltransferase [Gammaproteobacteria bacterium]
MSERQHDRDATDGLASGPATPADPARSRRLWWEFVAGYWKRFENIGLDPAHLEHFLVRLQAPVAVIGAGHGLLVEHLQSNGLHCVGLDWSVRMARSAVQRRGISVSVGDARALPFADRAFRSVVIATGILDPRHPPGDGSRVLSEAARVLDREGVLLAAFFVPNQQMRQELGERPDQTSISQHLPPNVPAPFADERPVVELIENRQLRCVDHALDIEHGLGALLAVHDRD